MPDSTDPFLKQIGQRLKQLRQNAKLTQVQLAKTVALDYRHYQNLEAGHSNFKITTIKKLADFYGISIATFFEDQLFQDAELKPQQFLLGDGEGSRFTFALVERHKEKWNDLEIGVNVYDGSGKVLFMNEYWCKILGITRTEAESKYFWDFVAEKNREHLKEYFKFNMERMPPPKTYIDEGSVKELGPYMLRAEWDYLYNDQESVQANGIVSLVWPIRPSAAATDIPENTVH